MIPIRNIWHMLAYAFGNLNSKGFRSIETESFENIADLSAEILAKGVAQLLKRGIGKDYVAVEDEVCAIRGRIAFAETIRTNAIVRKRLVCGYDEFSVNSYMNRILRTTMELLVRADISPARRRALRSHLARFARVEPLDPSRINWRFNFNRNNHLYRTLMNFCALVIKGLLMTQRDGSVRVMEFLDDRKIHALYEKFILEYYRSEFPGKTSAGWIRWQLDEAPDEVSASFLPVMKTDITLSLGGKVLILDAKYYMEVANEHYDRERISSAHLYQVFGYVQNRAIQDRKAGKDTEVSGMLLYAKPDDMPDLRLSWKIAGNRIGARTLDLNCEFPEIRRQLNAIAEDHFGCTMRS